MSETPSHPSIPAEALARRARLQAVLSVMRGAGASLEPRSLQDLRNSLDGGFLTEIDTILAAITADHLEEEASGLARAFRHEAGTRDWADLIAARLAPLAAKVQRQRASRWHLDTRHQLVRCFYKKETPAIGFDEGEIQAIFLLAFQLEGLAIALDFGKRARPLLSPGLPLPAGVGGMAETMDVVLKREPANPPALAMEGLNLRLPAGLRIHGWVVLPDYASTVSELALLSHWRWDIPQEQLSRSEQRVAAFHAASHWPWDRGTGKAGTQMDLRRLIPELGLERGILHMATRMGEFQAVNPLKMIGALLDLDASDIAGLVRTHVELRPDVRLSQAERFEPKLKNLYEDAVLLGGGSNIILVDEDDDEPLRLG